MLSHLHSLIQVMLFCITRHFLPVCMGRARIFIVSGLCGWSLRKDFVSFPLDGGVGFLPQKLCKYVVRICSFRCSLTAIKSLVLADDWTYSWRAYPTIYRRFCVNLTGDPGGKWEHLSACQLVCVTETFVTSPTFSQFQRRMSRMHCCHDSFSYIIVVQCTRLMSVWYIIKPRLDCIVEIWYRAVVIFC